MSKVINVSIYGGKDYLLGGRETQRRALIGSCEHADTCVALKQGRCSVADHLWQKCDYLEVSWVNGYTSRAKKFNEFMEKWRSHEKYNNIEKRLKRFEYVANDMVRIELPHIDVEKAAKGEKGYSATKSNNIGYIKRSDFTVETLINIMESYSYPALGGGKLFSKDKKEEMLIAIKEIDKKLYDEYIEKTGKTINYVGKKAYVNTLKPNIDLGEGWYWDGKYICKKESDRVECKVLLSFVKGSEICFIPEAEALIKIKDNNWVTDDTQFKVT